MTDWNNKLFAFIHDPPSKPFNVAEHRAIARKLIENAELNLQAAEWFFDKVCDHTAAAADRVVCPKSSAMHAEWRLHTAFKHPLGGGVLSFQEDAITADQAEALVTQSQNGLGAWRRMPTGRQEWARFFLHWRLWPQLCAEKHPSLAHLPADTRIPDHSIWTHCSLVSALQSCVEVTGQKEDMTVRRFKPSFLLVQIGPVQEFITQARTTRDVWSGSYLLSWLIAHGIKAVTDEVGPDCVLFPSLRGQPLFDFLHKAEIYEPLGLWNDLHHAAEQILIPNLPNRFLAIVPEWRAKPLAEKAAEAMRAELCKSISDACLKWFNDEDHVVEPRALTRWHQQLRQFLTVHWQTWAWTGSVETAIKEFAKLPNGQDKAECKPMSSAEALQAAFDAARTGIPHADLDPRNYKHRSWRDGDVWKSECRNANGQPLGNQENPIIENPGFAWAAHYGGTEFWLGARRNTRDFEPWGLLSGGSPEEQRAADQSREGTTKDMLSGREETIGPEDWQESLADIGGHLFGEGERLGALSLVKRVWHEAYLQPKGLQRTPRFDSLPAVAGAKYVIEAVDTLSESSSAWERLLAFREAAVTARSFFPARISNVADEREWLSKTDVSIFHQTEWDSAWRAEQRRKEGPRPDAIEKLTSARRALERLQQTTQDGGLGKPPTYIAILAMDGDSMGQWVSGAKSPLLGEQLANEARAYFETEHPDAHAPLALRRLLDAPRHVSPSYHLQFSEALANFSLYLARPIVESFDGQLIYSGGDDILAMLPADRVLDCACALRMAFRGDPELCTVFGGVLDTRSRDEQDNAIPSDKQPAWGFVAINGEWPGYSRQERELFPRGFHLLVPGRNADISAGIAIGHMHTPLQNLIETARQAEKIAKREPESGGYGKSAFAVHLCKRSGETIHWGSKWGDHAIMLADRFADLTQAGRLSAKFPYALARALRPYADVITAALPEPSNAFRIRAHNGFDAVNVFAAEFDHALRQHSDDKWRKTEGAVFADLANTYLDECDNRRLDDFLGPFLTTTFIRKGAD